MAAFAPPLRFCLLALLWLWRCAFAHAATLELNEAAGTRINLTPWWEVLQNMPREATIADVVGPQTAARFVAANPTIQGKQTDSVNFGMSSSAVWLRVTLHNTGSKDIERLLEAHAGNITNAARVAKKDRRALFELIRKHRIEPKRFRALDA